MAVQIECLYQMIRRIFDENKRCCLKDEAKEGESQPLKVFVVEDLAGRQWQVTLKQKLFPLEYSNPETNQTLKKSGAGHFGAERDH